MQHQSIHENNRNGDNNDVLHQDFHKVCPSTEVQVEHKEREIHQLCYDEIFFKLGRRPDALFLLIF